MESKGSSPITKKWPMVVSIVFAILFASSAIIAVSEFQNISSLKSENATLSEKISNLNQQVNLMQSQSTISKAEISQLSAEVNSTQEQLSSTQAQLNSTQGQLNRANSINNLQSSTTILNDQTINQPASSYSYYTLSAPYSGYFDVDVQSSSSSNTYVTVIWSAYGVSYSNTQTVGVQGSADFVVLPSSSIEVEIGNTNLVSGNSVTLSIFYYY